MATEYKYDVFISYSRKDYVDENKEVIPRNPISAIKEAFDNNGITYWFDEEGIYSGQAFVEIITEAISESKVFVFVSSKQSGQSQWTKSEIFEAFDRRKTIIPFRIDDTDYEKSLKFFLRPLDFISYYENKEKAIDDLIRSVNKVKDEIAEEEKKKQAEAQQKKIKENIKELVEDYKRLSSQQETILSDIVEQSQLLGVESKLCPVCEKPSKIDALFCDKCGWSFHPLFAIDENFSLADHKIHLSIFKAQWKSIGRIEEIKRKLRELTSENEQLGETKRKLEELTSENEQLRESYEMTIAECKRHLEAIEKDKHDFEQKEKESEHRLSIQLQESQDKILALEKERDELQANIVSLKEELAKIANSKPTKPNRKKKIKSSNDVSQILIECKKGEYYYDLFPDDSVIKTIDTTTLQSVLNDEYGINISLNSILSCESISELKSWILSKAGIS